MCIRDRLNIFPNTEELLSKMEEQKTKIELLENENQQWQKLAQNLNSENSLLPVSYTHLDVYKRQVGRSSTP